MYYLYILLCNNKTLYTGITNDLEKRMQTHKLGKGSKYVRAHLPFKLIYSEEIASKSLALKREFEIKNWSRVKKIQKLSLEHTGIKILANKAI